MLRILLVLSLSFAGATAHARCKGKDLRTLLNEKQIAHFTNQAAKVPFSEGMFWVATKGDQTIHIAGTLHSGDGRLNKRMRALSPYVRKADLVFLESVLTKEEKKGDILKGKERYFVIARPPYLDQLLKPSMWKELRKHVPYVLVNDETLKRLKPSYVADFVSNDDCDPFQRQRWKKGLDERIERLARRNRIPMMGLETVEQGFSRYHSVPVRDQAKLLELQLQSGSGYANVATTVRNTYFEEKLALGLAIYTHFAYADVKVSRKEVARLLRSHDSRVLDLRNKKWMPVLLSRKEKTIFVAVGGAHLPGQVGVLNLLRKKGYQLKRIPLDT